MGEENLVNERPNSVEVSRNAKGDCSWKIKLYYDNNGEATIKKIKELDSQLKKEFGK